jgi:hypothetical protein
LASVIAHELGHNFGLGHSSGEQCDAAVESAACSTTAYRDYYDVMGVSWARLGSLSAPQAARLGVLPAAQQQALTVRSSTTTVTLAPFAGRTGTRALRLTGADGVDYWLEYRTATGRDAWLGTAENRYHLQSGVLLRKAGGLPDTSLLLDGTPSAAAGWKSDLQEALPVGTAIRVSGGDFTVVVQSADANGAVLSVTPKPPVAAIGQVQRPTPPAVAGTVLRGARTTPDTPTSPAPPALPGNAVPAAAVPAPAGVAARPLRATAATASGADRGATAPVPVPLAGTALGGAVLLVAGSARWAAGRRRGGSAAPAARRLGVRRPG